MNIVLILLNIVQCCTKIILTTVNISLSKLWYFSFMLYGMIPNKNLFGGGFPPKFYVYFFSECFGVYPSNIFEVYLHNHHMYIFLTLKREIALQAPSIITFKDLLLLYSSFILSISIYISQTEKQILVSTRKQYLFQKLFSSLICF